MGTTKGAHVGMEAILAAKADNLNVHRRIDPYKLFSDLHMTTMMYVYVHTFT